MDIRLICMDLDGTALRNDHETISSRLLAALECAWDMGISIVPVTGRQYNLLPEFLQQHPRWENLAVLCNGAQIRRLDTGEVLYRRDLSRKALLGLIELARKYQLPMEFSAEGRLHLTEWSMERVRLTPYLTFHREKILPKAGRIVDSLEPVCDKPVEKVNLMCIPPELRDRVVRDLEQLEVSAVWSGSMSMEITHPEATKGNALRQLCRMLDIPMEHVMSLGDSGNDLTMLREAGLGVAMGNAPDFVKAAADATTETNENDGAAIAIERYALNR